MPFKTMDIKPIETVYRGYRFRSRLEARWAVFFDAAGIPFEYEKEGFDVGGRWYLPDFWLPEQRCWIEIKGEQPDADYVAMLREFGQSDYPLVMFVGLPGERAGDAWCGFEYHGDSGGCYETDDVIFAPDTKYRMCLTVGYTQSGHQQSSIFSSDHENELDRLTPDVLLNDGGPYYPLVRAFRAAKQARF